MQQQSPAFGSVAVSFLLIDDQGEIWGNAAIQLKQSFGSASSEDDLSNYLVKNLGFVAVNGYGRSCQIRIRPSVVTHQALDSLIYWLADHKFDRILTSYFDTDWRIELHGAADIVAQRLLQLMSSEQLIRPGDFVSEKIQLESLPNSEVFASLLRNWPLLSGNLHQDGIRNVLHQLTRGRYFLVRQDRSSNQVVFQDIGSGFAILDNDWLSSARGMPVEQQKDGAYGSWIARRYRHVLQQPEIVAEKVDAIVSTTKYGRYRVRYNRLILPAGAPDGSKWLLCSSILDERIDLRLQPTREAAKVG